MPEGPEVLVLANNLNDVLSGKYFMTCLKDDFSHFKNLESLPSGNKLLRVYCRGKKIIFEFKKGYLLSSLGMSGSWYLGDYTNYKSSTLFKSVWCEVYKKTMKITHLLCYSDPRHFGWLEYYETEAELNSRCDLGLDILALTLSGEIEFESWKKALLRGKKSMICLTLMEQKYISGIGNHLRSNILYHAHINPRRLTGDLTDDELKRLYDSGAYIIEKCYREGGAKGDYVDLFGNYGKYEHLVYGRTHDSFGNRVESFNDKNNRKVWYVPTAQK